MADTIEKLGRTVAVVAAVIAATVSANTLLTTCAQRNLDRYAGFRAAVGSEEAYWKSLYDDYLTIFGPDFTADAKRRREKVLALYTLAQRTPASFTEHDVSESEKQEAARRIEIMQTRLLNSLDEQGADDPILKAELERRSYKGKQARIAAAAPSGTAPAPAPVVAPPPQPQSSPPRPVTEVLTGESATGWDVDLYWCQGAGEGDHYRLARGLGDYFAEISRSGRSIGPGVTLGQIRTRPATSAQYAGLRFPAPGNWVIWDSGAGEEAAAQALLQAAGNSAIPGATDARPIHSNGKPTRWRLSAFFCSGTGGG
ncbi:MAG: hypothetical protein ACJ8ER_12440 [Allosphingosinicella sp.]